MTTRLAWKNLLRNKTRTGVLILAAFLGFGVALLAANLMRSISTQRTTDAINTQASDLQITRKGFNDNKDINLQIDGAENIIHRVQSFRQIKGVAKRLRVNAVLSSPENTVAGEVIGVIPKDEVRVNVLKEFIKEGSYLSSPEANEILVSRQTADKLRLHVHSKVLLTFQDVTGQIVGGSFKVAGIFITPATPFDESTFLVHYADLQALSQAENPHEIAIKLTSLDDLSSSRTSIASMLPASLAVSTWKELLPELMAFDGFLNMVSTLFLVVIVLGLAFSLFNTMNMVIVERSDEIKMLRVIGMSRKKILELLVKESGLMMLTGLFSGTVLGMILISITSYTGVKITDDGGSIGVRSVIYPGFHPDLFILLIVAGLLITILVSLLPAYKAARASIHISN